MSVILGVTSKTLGYWLDFKDPFGKTPCVKLDCPSKSVSRSANRRSLCSLASLRFWFMETLRGQMQSIDLGGTNYVTDAAWRSFSAISMAINELYLGDSDIVIAGGADTMSDILMHMCFSKTPALSKSGDVRPFSDQADGTLLGEGIAIFAFKRLADAERDGDRIYGVLKGLGASSDGRSKSVCSLAEGQAKAYRRAYAMLVDPKQSN